jgi:GNAT superfamily N-acetyltransferase
VAHAIVQPTRRCEILVEPGHMTESMPDPGPYSHSLTVRRAAAADARAIAEINVAGWQAAYRGLMPEAFLESLSADQRELAWRARLEGGADAGDPAWVAELDGEPVGYLVSGPPRDEDAEPGAVEIYAVYVRPDVWRSGVGRRLIEVATAEWWRRGATSLLLWVLEGNTRARSFYEALGWTADGSTKTYDMGGFTTLEARYRLER